MLKPTRILVPTDFSEHSDRSVSEGLDMAQQYKAALYLLHVVGEEFRRCGHDYCLSDELVQKMEMDMLSGADQGLRNQLAKFPQARNVEVMTEVRRGFPGEEILNLQEEKGVDLIVITRLGRTGLAKYFVGSVTSTVVKGAKCPVLIIK